MTSKCVTLLCICAAFVVNSSGSGKQDADKGEISFGGIGQWPSDIRDWWNKVQPEQVTLYLYTRSNRSSGTLITKDTIKEVKMNKKIETKIISHGWRGTHEVLSVQTLKNTYLENRACNVILVDWSPIANKNNYFYPVRVVHKVGYFVANMINELIANGLKPSNTHLIGFSLGAHVVAEAGNHIVKKLPRVTILDAAKPGVSNYTKFATAAKFVDVIHTGGKQMGIYDELGTADFYVNGGTAPQADCPFYDWISKECSHNYAYVVFAESIRNGKKFPGRQCKASFRTKISELDCVGSRQYMGDSVSKSASGCYYVKAEGLTVPTTVDTGIPVE